LAILLKKISQKAAITYPVKAEVFLSSFVSAEKYFEFRSLEILHFIAIHVTRMTTIDPQWVHESAICVRRITNIKFCNVSFEKGKGITFDELSAVANETIRSTRRIKFGFDRV